MSTLAELDAELPTLDDDQLKSRRDDLNTRVDELSARLRGAQVGARDIGQELNGCLFDLSIVVAELQGRGLVSFEEGIKQIRREAWVHIGPLG